MRDDHIPMVTECIRCRVVCCRGVVTTCRALVPPLTSRTVRTCGGYLLRRGDVEDAMRAAGAVGGTQAVDKMINAMFQAGHYRG
jgi:hypothetical protein